MRKPVGKNPVRIQKIPKPEPEEVDDPEPIKMDIKDIPKEEIFENKSSKVELKNQEVLRKEAPEPTYRRKRQLSEKQLAALAKGRAAKAAKRAQHKKDREELLKLRQWKQQMEKNTRPPTPQPRAQPRPQPRAQQPRRRTMTKEQLGRVRQAQTQQFFQLLDQYEKHKKAKQPAPKPKYKETTTPNPFNLHQYQRRRRRY